MEGVVEVGPEVVAKLRGPKSAADLDPEIEVSGAVQFFLASVAYQIFRITPPAMLRLQHAPRRMILFFFCS